MSTEVSKLKQVGNKEYKRNFQIVNDFLEQNSKSVMFNLLNFNARKHGTLNISLSSIKVAYLIQREQRTNKK